jgi:SagB-type dehydrogenase family enzyme
LDDDIRNKGMWEEIHAGRRFMNIYRDECKPSDMERGLPYPPLFKPAGGGDKTPLTTDFKKELLKSDSYLELINKRRSLRDFSDEPITQEQLAFLLWSTQGVQRILGGNYASLRPVAGGGGRHEFETYFTARENGIEGMRGGAYHYLPFENAVEYLRPVENYHDTLSVLLAEQEYFCSAPVVFFWACAAYRAEWKCSNWTHRASLMNVGHIGQQMYLSATALGLGACCVCCYMQDECDSFFGLDGSEEFVTYVCPVGRAKEGA